MQSHEITNNTRHLTGAEIKHTTAAGAAFDVSHIDYVLDRLAAGLDLADAPIYVADEEACMASVADPWEAERLWPGRVKFLPGKDGMWVVDRRWAVCCAYPEWVAIDLHARENATVERASVGDPADTLATKITDLIGPPAAYAGQPATVTRPKSIEDGAA